MTLTHFKNIIVPMSERTAITPLDHQLGIKLAAAPYAEVKRIFESPESKLPYERGDYERSDKKPYFTPGLIITKDTSSYTIPEDNHVRSSYTPEQHTYLTTTMACLNMVLEGKDRKKDQTPPSLESRIITRFYRNIITQDSPSLLFTDAVAPELRQVFIFFQDRYPNLMPALIELSRAGSIGTIQGLVLRPAALFHFLNQSQEEKEMAIALETQHKRFIGKNWYLGKPKYEIHCPGESFAVRAIKQQFQAAEKLAACTWVTENYNWNNPDTERKEVNSRSKHTFAATTNELLKFLSQRSQFMHEKGVI